MEWNQSDIIKACRKQNKKAQKALFQRYSKQFYGLCLRYVNNREVAEEVLMDAFMDIFKNIKKYKTKSFEAWMKSIVVHKSIDYYRKHKNDPMFSDVDTDYAGGLSNPQTNDVEMDELLKMLYTLPSGYRMVFNLFAIEGYQHKEIAKQLGISESTSKTQFLKAKQKLQIIMEKGGYHG